MTLKDIALQGFLGLAFYKLAGQGATWLISIVVARILNPEDFGLMALAVVFINLFSYISEFGLSSALIQKKDLDEFETHASFWFLACFNLLMYALILTLSYPVSSFYKTPQLTHIIQVLGLNFLISSFRTIPMCLLTRRLDFVPQARAEFHSAILGSASICVLAALGFGVWSLVLGSLLQHLASTALLLYYHPWWPRLILRFRHIRAMLTFGMSVNASKMLTYLTDNSDNLIIGKVLGEKALGLYNLAFILGTIPANKMGSLLYHILFPLFSRLQHDRPALHRYFLKANKYVALVAFPSLIGLLIVSGDFVPLVLGPKWLPIVLPLRILCLVGILRFLTVTLSPLLYSLGKPRLVLRFSLFNGIVLPLAFYASTAFGIVGVAAAWAAIYPVGFLYLLRRTLQELELPVSTYAANLFQPAAATLVLAGAVAGFQLFTSSITYMQFVGSCVVGVAAYSMTLVLIDKETVRELNGLARSFRPFGLFKSIPLAH